MPSGDAARRRADRDLGGALLLDGRPRARPRRGTARALRVARPLRAAARAARRARAAARRVLPRSRRREPPCRPRGSRALGRRVHRQEHDAHHAHARVLGRARDARHGRRGRGHADASRRAAAPARSASTPARPTPSTSPASSTRRGASPTGRRRRARCRTTSWTGSTTASTDATSARTSARGTAASRSAGPGSSRRDDAQPVVSLTDWLTRDGPELIDELERLYVPKNDPRWLRRNALVALGNVGRPGDERHVEPALADPDDSLRAAAARAASRIAERSG